MSVSALDKSQITGFNKTVIEVKDNVWCHISLTVKPKDAGKVLPRVPTMLSNSKRTFINGTVLKKW
jgi:hypothetical protein